MTRSPALMAGVLTLLFSPLGCDLQNDTRLRNIQEDGAQMTPSKDSSAQAGTSRPRTGVEEKIVPIVQEEVHIDTEQVETGRVRLTKTSHEREVVVEEPSVHEEVQIERVPVNRFVAEPVAVRHEGDTMIIPVMEEVAVVETRLRLKEEMRVTKRRITTTRGQPVRLRTEEVHVERVPGEANHVRPPLAKKAARDNEEQCWTNKNGGEGERHEHGDRYSEP
jgi:uncharacterized protein (TIGR02271 family)